MSAVPLSVVVTAAAGFDTAIAAAIAVRAQVAPLGGEVIVAGPEDESHDEDGIRWLGAGTDDAYAIIRHAVDACRGEVIALGEDHALPRPGWCEGIVAAHAARPTVPLVVGALCNGTDRTRAGRATFLGFAAAWTPAAPRLASHRPPPLSTMSFKRWALDGCDDAPASLVAHLGQLVVSGRAEFAPELVVDHFQDHGLAWAVGNAFRWSRAGFGRERASMGRGARLRRAVAVTANPRTILREAMACPSARRGDVLAVLPIAIASGAGAVVGTLVGPGAAAAKLT